MSDLQGVLQLQIAILYRSSYLLATLFLCLDNKPVMLALSSLLFGTNVIHAFQKGKLFYAGLFLLLTVTAVMWHSCPKLEPNFMTIFWMDQAALWAVLIMSTVYLAGLKLSSRVVLAVLIAVAVSISIYLGTGSWTRSYPTEHATLHLIGSLAGHTILF